MECKQHIVNEFEIRVFQESYERIHKCLTLLNENEIWFSPNENTVSVGCLVKHLVGNARQWILSGIGTNTDLRDRDAEFIGTPDINKEQLILLMENLRKEISKLLPSITESHLNSNYRIQGFGVTGFSVFVHVIEHFSYHTGQISLLTKIMKNQDLGYYDQDLNMRNSE